jgi:uncharacterized protein
LALAAQKGKVSCLECLLRAGAEVDLSNLNGSTPLIQASHFGHSEVVHLLLLHRASVNIRNNKGTTALMRAAQEGHRQGNLTYISTIYYVAMGVRVLYIYFEHSGK